MFVLCNVLEDPTNWGAVLSSNIVQHTFTYSSNMSLDVPGNILDQQGLEPGLCKPTDKRRVQQQLQQRDNRLPCDFTYIYNYIYIYMYLYNNIYIYIYIYSVQIASAHCVPCHLCQAWRKISASSWRNLDISPWWIEARRDRTDRTH